MKVTVCFGPVRVVVPCGNGDILVRDLIQQAVVRYRKAAGKAPDAWVGVTALRSSDGALLDLDDRLRDVVDDREQLVACTGLEDPPGLTLPFNRDRIHNPRGDGTSASSDASSPSPDFLQGTNHAFQPFSRKDIEVTGGENIPSATLQVRRGSEPVLNRLTPEPHTVAQHPESPKAKRWSAAAIIDEVPAADKDHNENLYAIRPSDAPRHDNFNYAMEERRGGLSVEARRQRFMRHDNNANANDRYATRFSRTGPRVSMQINAYRWAEAADAALRGTGASSSYGEEDEEDEHENDEADLRHRRTQSLRREPVGATSNPSPLPDGDAIQSELVVLANEGGPLGIHVVPDYDANGQDNGLQVQGIEMGGRVGRDGRLQLQDRIVEINGQPLLRVPFHRAQEVFRQAMQAPELRLRVVKRSQSLSQQRPQQQHHQRQLSSSTDRGDSPANSENRCRVIGGYSDERDEDESKSVNAKVAAVSPTRKSPGLATTAASGLGANVPGSQGNVLMTGNTRKLGKKLEVELVKGNNGLGFSVTTRDNPAGALCPIYIKNVLPKGAAIEDGRLKAGDRLLEVNGTEVTGLSQEEVVTLLRSIPTGSTAHILISRLQDDEASPKLPRQMKTLSHASEESLIFPWKHREILTLDIPVHDSERAGLGVSVKGKTSTGIQGTVDLGIFVKSVIHGGAASRDGRLRTNDQLLHVNGYSLLGRSNSEAMETLRKAVHQEGPTPGVISLTVARKVNQQPTAFSSERHGEPQQPTSDMSEPAMQESSQSRSDNDHPSRASSLPNGNNSGGTDSSGYSDQSGSTVIFVGEGGQRYTGKVDDQDLGTLATPPRNPVIDRLTGRQTFHNESYYRATHNTWNATQLQELVPSEPGGSGRQGHSPVNRNFQPSHPQSSPTVTAASGEVVTIEGDYQPQRPRPPSVPTYNRADTPDSYQGRYYTSGNGENARDAGEGSEPPPSPSVKSDRPSDSDAPTYASQTSLDESGPGFSRDQIGRQSMSEKRHAVLDAKNTDTYQRNKKMREERDRQRQMQLEMQQQQLLQHREAAKSRLPAQPIVPSPPSRDAEVRKRRDIGPTLGMKKSSSLESLQTMVQEIQEEESVGCYGYRPAAVRVVRGRGCNESFRAAVDRSYDAPIEGKGAMETLDEEGDGDRSGPMQLLTGPGASSTNTSDDKSKKGKKKPGLLKGLGSMFRFGKNRRGLESNVASHPGPEAELFESEENLKPRERRPSAGAPSSKPEVDRHHVLRRTLPSEDRGELSRVLARQAAQEEQRRIQEQYRRLVEQQQSQQHQHQQEAPHGDQRLGPPEPPTRSKSNEKFHYIRAEHQRRHAERQGQYAHDEQEEKYEQTLRQRFEPVTQSRPSASNKPAEVSHTRSASYDPYNEVRRPGSRVGVATETSPAPLGPVYDQYVNYQEVQHQIRQCLSSATSPPQCAGSLSPMQMWAMQETVRRQRMKVEMQSRRQQHYHSQRGFRENRDPRGDRPVSNYFEYESLQQRAVGGSTLPWNPPRPPFGPTFLPPPAPGPVYGQQPFRNAPDAQNNSLSRKHARSNTGGKGPAPAPPPAIHTLPGYRSQNQSQFAPPALVRTVPGAPSRPAPPRESYRPYGPPFALAGSKV